MAKANNNRNKGRKSNDRYNKWSKQRGSNKAREDGNPKLNGEAVKGAEPINDVSYYIPEGGETLVEQLNTYSFEGFNGIPLNLGTIMGQVYTETVGNIMQILVRPSMSFTDSSNSTADGVNVEALRTYTKLSAQNGKTTQYAPQDVTILLLAVGNLLAQFSWLARAFGVIGLYNYRNRSYPIDIVKACGFDANDLKTNLADYRARYNYLVHKFNQIPIPANIEYFKKCSKMFQSVYLDEEGSPLAQSYVFTPLAYWQFDEAYNSNGSGLHTMGALSTVDTLGSGFTYQASFAAALNNLETCIDQLLQSTTLNFVYSDILRLHNKDGMTLLSLTDIPYSYAILPSKVEELSIWLNNATVLGAPESTPETVTGLKAFTVADDVESDANNNCVIHRPQFKSVYDMTGFTPILNFKHDNPSLDERVYSTRLSHQMKTVLNSASNAYITTEVTMTDWYIQQFTISSGVPGDYHNITGSILPTSAIAGLAEKWSGFLAALSKFDWHPYIYLVDDHTPGYYVSNGIVGDTNFYTKISYDLLRKIDDVAMMGLISVR